MHDIKPLSVIDKLCSAITRFVSYVNTYVTSGGNSFEIIYGGNIYVTIEKAIWRPCFTSSRPFGITHPILSLYRSVVSTQATSIIKVVEGGLRLAG